MVDQIESRVLELRSAGRSYGAIAKTLGLKSARDALATFQNGLRRRPVAKQVELRTEELRRLDEFVERLRDEPGLSEQELGRKLELVDRLRGSLVDRRSA